MSNINEYTNDKLMTYGPVTAVWSANGNKILKVQQEIWHKGLNEYKVISGQDKAILKNKVIVQVDKWNKSWKTYCEKKNLEDIKKACNEEAVSRTQEAEEKLQEVENILIDALEINSAVDWDVLKNKEEFKIPYPVKPDDMKLFQLPSEPDKNALEFQPKLNFFSSLIPYLKNKVISEAELAYKNAYENWEKNYNRVIQKNIELTSEYENNMNVFKSKVEEWNLKNSEYIKEQNDYNTEIDQLKSRYLSSDVNAIAEYCEIVLSKSPLPDFFQKEFEVDYNPDNKILVIDYLLPNIEEFPSVKEVKYIASKNELKEVYQNSAFMEKLFDATIYKMILRVIQEEFNADVINVIDAISFNGWINYLNKATGKKEDACIVSIQVKKEVFNEIDLRNVEPKVCFKSLKGVGSSKLAGITPIQPILVMNKNDKRFIESYNVADKLDDSINLASIPWEDFEQLITELFQAEFSSTGGEVKVTQASRDGGVDAVAFDPDPIRGGKIVIQAKRYTNTVGVSAVRDLYGTVMNEGATKGILVTTADYGPDAYEFAKNKPLTLLNGGNVLHMLEKHGHKAKIDLKEAKMLNMANNS